MLVLHPMPFGNKRKRPCRTQRTFMLKKLSEAQNHKCCHCGGRLLFSEDGVDCNNKNYASIEHFIPHVYGGDWSFENLLAAHRGCNQYYTDITSDGFSEYRKLLETSMNIVLNL